MVDDDDARKLYNGKRSVILRRLKRVDLRSCMDSLDKYSTLARSLFKADSASIAIVDDSIVWVLAGGSPQKTILQLHSSETCYYDLLMDPSRPNILIISDRRNLPSTNGVVNNPSENIFFAGIALEVEGARVGTLTIQNKQARTDFGPEEINYFSELAACISDVMQSQMRLSDQLILGWTNLMVGVTHNLRTPLSIVTLSISEAMAQISKIHKKHAGTLEGNELLQSLDNCRDAEIAAQQLQLVIDANSNLGNLILSYESKITPRIMMNILTKAATHAMVSRIRQRLLIMEDNHSIQWFINEINLADKTHRTFTDAIEQSIASAIAQFMVQHAEISVYINFESETTAGRDLNVSLANEGYIVVEVTFQVETDESHFESKTARVQSINVPKDHPNTLREFDTFSQRFELQLIERLLKVIGGRISKLSTADGRSGRLVLQFPCEILTELKSLAKSDHVDDDTANIVLPSIGSQQELPSKEPSRKSTSTEIQSAANVAEAIAENILTLHSHEAKKQEINIDVLIIEDAIPVQKILAASLKRKGCEVQTAINGKLGLDKLKSCNFDIVFCDFLMPVQDGVTTMRLYQQHLNSCTETSEASFIKKPLIIGISATASMEELTEAFSFGMAYFCQKPLAPEVLNFIIHVYQQHHEDLRSLDTAFEDKGRELVGLGKPMALVSAKSL